MSGPGFGGTYDYLARASFSKPEIEKAHEIELLENGKPKVLLFFYFLQVIACKIVFSFH